MLTQEKAEAIAAFLNADDARAQNLVEMSAEDAVKAMQADGLEITAEELSEFGEIAEKNAKNASGELDEAALENVAGGVWRPIIWPIRPLPTPILWPLWKRILK